MAALVTAVTASAALAACQTPPTSGPASSTTTIDDWACDIERDTIETALAAWVATRGGYPSTLEEMVGVFLDDDALTLPWTYSTDGSTYSLTGPC